MLYFLVAVFNEEENIPVLAERITNCMSGYDKYFIFVDDGSSDKTKETIERNFSKHNFLILGDGKNHGPGYSFNVGFEKIISLSNSGEDKIITIEGDNTSDIGILNEMIKISELNYDLVLASVYAQGGGFKKTSLLRKFISTVANLTFRFFFNINVLTLSSFYRVYNIGMIKKIKNQYGIIISETGFICMLEILIKAIYLYSRIIEVPMILDSQQRKGKSKLKLLKTTFSYFRFLMKKRQFQIK